MALVIKAIDKRNRAKRKFIAPSDGYEAGFFRWVRSNDAKLRDNAEFWPCVYVDGILRTEGTATVFGFLQGRANHELEKIVADIVIRYSLGYKHDGFPRETRIEYLPPYDKYQW